MYVLFAWSANNLALHDLAPTPCKKIRKLHYEMRKSESALLTQMRTEKSRLSKFLHAQKVSDFESPHCECLQTARHILTIGPKFSTLRRQK